MAGSESDDVHGTVRIPMEHTASRTIRIGKTLAEVRAAWTAAKLPGNPEFVPAAENRGIDLTVEIDKHSDSEAERLLSPYEGESIAQQLESALRDLKARIETGEIATIEGQSSGRSA